MSGRWWNPFDGMEQIAFKPMEGGYLYRAPNPWLVGRARYYHINEAQKAELAVHHRRTMQATFWAIVVGAAVGAPVAARFTQANAWLTLAACLLIGLLIGAVLNLHLARKVAPVVAPLTPVAGRITPNDSFRTQAAIYPMRNIVLFVLLDLALFVLVVANAMFGTGGWDVMAVAGAALFGGGMLYFIALGIAKHRQTTA